MKYLFIFLYIVLGACGIPRTSIDKTHSTTVEKVTEIARQVQIAYVPDKRTDLFDYEITGTTYPQVKLETTVHQAAETLINQIKEAGINASFTTDFLPSAELGGNTYGLVLLSVSNNRKEPDHSAELVTQMIMGTPVRLLKREQGYYLVRSPDQYISWVDAAAIKQMDSTQFLGWQKADKVVYTSDYGYATQQPDVNSTRVSDLVNGSLLQLTGKVGDFYRVLLPDNRAAYIPIKDMTPYDRWVTHSRRIGEDVVKTAKAMIGVPYLWGGTSIKGVDCSGFTKTCYFLNGVILARDASQQALTGIPIDIREGEVVSVDKCLRNLQVGDLLFFTNTTKKVVSHPAITHTAIYMGGGEFIQSAGMVRINSLVSTSPVYDEYRLHTLVGARRMLNAIGSPQITDVDQHPYYKNVIHE